MLYPFYGECLTQPRVTIRNITVRNVDIHGGVFTPGIIRCNETNPCTDFTFENVKVTGWFSEKKLGYITENVYGSAINVIPDPGFNSSTSATEIERIKEMIKNRPQI